MGKIIDRILNEGFEISALQMFYLDRPTSEEFYEVYKVNKEKIKKKIIKH